MTIPKVENKNAVYTQFWIYVLNTCNFCSLRHLPLIFDLFTEPLITDSWITKIVFFLLILGIYGNWIFSFYVERRMTIHYPYYLQKFENHNFMIVESFLHNYGRLIIQEYAAHKTKVSFYKRMIHSRQYVDK